MYFSCVLDLDNDPGIQETSKDVLQLILVRDGKNRKKKQQEFLSQEGIFIEYSLI